ncbi:MAG: glycosyltransferase family 4 protein [Flavobacteriales bacterium]|nr:glycosyltransferase family 4 protein [Flavobacteriales bacterium]
MKGIKVLIIVYYWPPSGGAGVQRWVKLTKYMTQYGLIPYVLTVHEDYASYMQLDESLCKDISPEVNIFKTKSFEPINYYSKIVGKKNVPTAGFSNVDNTSFVQKAVNAIRSNLFIPDPRRGWNRYAYKKAKEIIRKENIELVITTSPPHSTQLIGLKLKQNLNVKWIADLRDPWTDIYYYKILGHSFLSRRIDKYFERKVLEKSDKIITVSEGFKDLFIKENDSVSGKIKVIPNGFDSKDFQHLIKKPNKVFTICYTGTISEQYNLSSFISAIRQVQDDNEGVKVNLQIVGSISKSTVDEILSNNLDLELVKTVPHSEVTQYQKNADLLLLIIPDVQYSAGIIPAKVFEYLASGNHILCLGPSDCDAARIIDKCEMGQTIERTNRQAIVDYLKEEYLKFEENQENEVNFKEINSFSRESQAEVLAETVKSMTSVFDK